MGAAAWARWGWDLFVFVVGVVISTVGLVMQSTMHSFLLAGLGIRSQTMGFTLRSHSSGAHLPHKTPLPSDLFIHFTFSYPSFFAQHPTKFHQFLHTLPHSSHEYPACVVVNPLDPFAAHLQAGRPYTLILLPHTDGMAVLSAYSSMEWGQILC